MSLGDQLWEQFGGDVPSSAREVARDAIQRYGSGRAAGRALGVDEAQIRRWRDGKVSSSPNVERIVQDMRAQMAANRAGTEFALKFRHAGRDRTPAFGEAGAAGGKRGLRDGTEARMRAAYVRGDKRALAKAFVDGIADRQWQRMIRRAADAEDSGATGGEGSDEPGVFVS